MLTHKHFSGKRTTPTYNSWQSMIARCYRPENTSYYHYGAKGVKVCKRWKKFENFLLDMGIRPDGHTLDRIDNKKGYGPTNCRWATKADQILNRSSTILINGKCLVHISKELGGSKSLVWGRIQQGWKPERAATTPARKRSMNTKKK